MKIRPFGAELFHADRRTYVMKLIVAFRKVCQRANIQHPYFKLLVSPF